MSELLNAIAGAFGLSTGFGSGTWDGIGHVWSVINGKKMDAVGMVNRGSFFNYPASGPAPKNYSGNKTEHTVNFNVDLKNVPKDVNEKELKSWLMNVIKDKKIVKEILKGFQTNKGDVQRALG